MAVTPDQVENNRNKINVDSYIEIIDQHLMNYDGSWPMWLDADFFSKSPRVCNRIVDTYKAAGWIVTFHSDQRDGDAYSFAPRTTSSDSYEYPV